MTKRSYPFEFGVLRQLKVHLNTFECDKAALKDIERKTLEKLFMAQKKNPEIYQTNIESSFSSKDKNFKQTQLSSYFTGVNGNPQNKDITGNMNFSNAMNICAYCDKKSDNIYKCRICLQPNCQSCSFPDYSCGNDEIRICVTCS